MKRILFILSFFFCIISNAQITYFNSASTPADNGTNTATTTAVTPPASMVTGDLVVLVGYQRGTATMSISQASGQTWNTGPYVNASSTMSTGVFWCRYNGTWGADPSILFSAGTNTNVVMHVFRPTSSSNDWGIDDGGSNNWALFIALAPSSPFTCTAQAFNNTVNASTVALALFTTDDDNTWGSLSGAGWALAGSTQYRNTSGSDMSSVYAYIVKSSAASAIANVSFNQATLGGDGYIWSRLVWYEFTPAATTPKPHTLLGVGGKQP